jgi:hypothetical protein
MVRPLRREFPEISRRAANEPLQTVAIRFRISPSHVTKIQQAIESQALFPEQVQLFAQCKVKN